MKYLQILLLTLFSTLIADDMSSSKLLYFKNACSSCHGIYGEGAGAYPRLQGIDEKLLLQRLINLKAGKTRSAFGTIMISFAKSLDENQTKNMAKYLSNLKTKIEDDRYDEEYDPAGDGGS